jgi:hypothetical protein
MTAAAVRPQTGAVVFASGPALQKNPGTGVDDEDGKRPVQLAAILVSTELFLSAKGIVVLVDQDHLGISDRILIRHVFFPLGLKL